MNNYFCNPMNLPMQYLFNLFGGKESVLRMSSDTSMIYLQGRYYLFGSFFGGYFTSDDLCNWQFCAVRELPFSVGAPDVCMIGDTLYLSANFGDPKHPRCIYACKGFPNGTFEPIEGTRSLVDSNFFYDDDGRLYFYYGCSDRDPLWGLELDVNTMKPISEPVAVIYPNPSLGFERFGEDHVHEADPTQKAWIEGAYMTKHNGKYYLQYAAPNTEYNSYADGVYVGDLPLGTFTAAKNNPFSYHPGGFLRGAGHGSTFRDGAENIWHVSSGVVSVNFLYERRAALFRAGFDADGELVCDQRYADWPVRLPRDGEKFSLWEEPDQYLLSYGKTVRASSEAEGCPAKNMTDESIRTHWKASSNSAGEWAEIDLGALCEVHSVQINFADDHIRIPLPEGAKRDGHPNWTAYVDTSAKYTRWRMEGSADSVIYETICDKWNAESDLPHDFVQLEKPRMYRYIRCTFREAPYAQPATVSGLRVFGKGKGEKPQAACITQTRWDGELDLYLSWKAAEGASGYNILWGYAADKLYHSYMIYGKNEQTLRAINAGQALFVRIDTFNENGITSGEVMRLR